MTVVVLSSLTSLLSPNYKFFKPIHSTFNFNYFSNIHLHHPPRFMRLCGHTRRDQDKYTGEYEMGFDEEEKGLQIPTQAQSVVEGSGAVLVSEFKPVPDIDYLQATILLQIL
ncbi:hypothetical protein Lalb_Chr18g0044971 [Lupinus albus]|uniref:Uncharacterized protein n=1 Tax=Lupinus albus TaxID=3870 RepID=A0A6A4P3S1_LUPAL|nr:hypothetical protein Lalb_Chr18g0044971 [Lupinus albus]